MVNSNDVMESDVFPKLIKRVRLLKKQVEIQVKAEELQLKEVETRRYLAS